MCNRYLAYNNQWSTYIYVWIIWQCNLYNCKIVYFRKFLVLSFMMECLGWFVDNTCTCKYVYNSSSNYKCICIIDLCIASYCRALKVLLKGDLVVLVFYKHINNVLYFIFFKFKIKLLPEFKLNTLSPGLCQVPKWLVICNPSRSWIRHGH